MSGRCVMHHFQDERSKFKVTRVFRSFYCFRSVASSLFHRFTSYETHTHTIHAVTMCRAPFPDHKVKDFCHVRSMASSLFDQITSYSTWASYQIRKIAGCACAGNAGNVFPRRRFLRDPLVSDPGMHHGTCVTHVPWCMPGSLTCGDGEHVPGIPGACASAILRIWQEAHEGAM